MKATALTYDEARSNAEKIADAVLKARILRGMELLKERFGEDWVEHIDIDSLSMHSPDQCVLGQLYEDAPLTAEQRQDLAQYGNHYSESSVVPGYFKGLVIIDGEMQAAPGEFGFDTYGEETYAELGEGWLTVFGEEE